ncbi:MAG TPA: ribosome small subunit-dependent GTPase A [Armatimonadota bacterium]
MKFQDKQRLRAQLEKLGENERKKLVRQAAQLRKDAIRKGGHVPSHDDMLLRVLENAPTFMHDCPPAVAGQYAGQIVRLTAGRALVLCDDGEQDMPLAPALAQVQQSAIAVGDQVRWGGTPPYVTTVLPRRTRLSRPDPGAAHIERIIAANIDVVVLVTSLKLPPCRPRLLDRILLAVEHGGAAPLIVATKVDLLGEEERASELARLQRYRQLGIPVIACSSASGEGIPMLRESLCEKTCVMVGHSGVGKSSLLNALDPALRLSTNDLRKGDGKGRHTTTASRLYRLEGGISLIDTPGVREFGLWRMSGAEIRGYFPEFVAVASGCAFADCSHTHEPHCAVKEAVQCGDIAHARYATYRRLLGEGTDTDLEEMVIAEISFTCAHCRAPVASDGAGSAHRNHCPHCLWSLHLDERPGDRAAGCSGHMEPVAVWARKGGEWALIHRCQACGVLRSNRIAADDNELLLMSLAVRPLAQPPFRLEVVAP